MFQIFVIVPNNCGFSFGVQQRIARALIHEERTWSKNFDRKSTSIVYAKVHSFVNKVTKNPQRSKEDKNPFLLGFKGYYQSLPNTFVVETQKDERLSESHLLVVYLLEWNRKQTRTCPLGFSD